METWPSHKTQLFPVSGLGSPVWEAGKSHSHVDKQGCFIARCEELSLQLVMWSVKSQPPLCLALAWNEDRVHSPVQWGLLGRCCSYSWGMWRFQEIEDPQAIARMQWLITYDISPSVSLGIDARMGYIHALLAVKPPWNCEAIGGYCTLGFLFPRRSCKPWRCGSWRYQRERASSEMRWGWNVFSERNI